MEPIIKISVVICTYNRAAYIAAALESLVQQTFNKNWFEVIVVNNNSTDNTEQICKKFIADHSQYAFYFLNETQQGASFARNTGADLAKGSLLCFMDDDAIADSDYLEKIVDFFETHTDAGGLGGRIIPKYIPEEPKWMSYYVASLVGNFDYSNNICVFQQGKYPLESNMIIRTADFKAIGGFNKNLPGVVGTMRIGGEGKDFFYRLQALGKKIYYHPGIIVHHVVEVNKLTKEYMYRVASGIGRGERRRVLAISRWAYVKKLIEYCFKLGAAFILAIQYTLQGNPAKAWPVIQFRVDAFKGLLNQ
ncbi:MAG: glycosyltransferase family 2 protein [Bacteroidota bacterium]